jgi:hypothetical protein
MNSRENIDFRQFSGFAEDWLHLYARCAVATGQASEAILSAQQQSIDLNDLEAFLAAFQHQLHVSAEGDALAPAETIAGPTENTWLEAFSRFSAAWVLAQQKYAVNSFTGQVAEERTQKKDGISISDLHTFLRAFACQLPVPVAADQAVSQPDPVPVLLRFVEQWRGLGLDGPLVVPRAILPALDGEALVSFAGAFAPLREQALSNGAYLNVWKVAGLRRNEQSIVSVLAWLLDAQASHGLGAAVSQAVLQRIRDKACAEFAAGPASSLLATLRTDAACRADCEVCPFDEQEDRIDLHLQAQDFELFIEAKVDARQGQDQLSRYHTKIRDLARLRGKRAWGIIYLTRHGQIPEDAGDLPNILPLSWREVAAAIRHGLQGQVKISAVLACQYADHIQSL